MSDLLKENLLGDTRETYGIWYMDTNGEFIYVVKSFFFRCKSNKNTGSINEHIDPMKLM